MEENKKTPPANNPTQSFPLGNGLELRVEPSFRFDFSPTEKVGDDFAKVIRRLEDFGELPCRDISVYNDGKLCLSPNDNYYNLQEYEAQVDRSLEIGPVKQTVVELAKRLTQTSHKDKIRVYEVIDADLMNLNPNLTNQDHIRLTRSVRGVKHDVLLTFSDIDVEPELIERGFARQYPQNRMPDKLLGNIFSVYFVKPGDLDQLRYFERAAVARYDFFGNNYPLIKASEATLMSLSYGHRLRTVGFDQEDLHREIEKMNKDH